MRVVVSGAEKLSSEVAEQWLRKFGLRIMEGYGATECAPVLSLNTPLSYRPGTVGRLLPGIEHRVLPVPGIPRGGVLHVRGPNLMRGYYLYAEPGVLQPPQSEAGPGWYNTGDIVEVDADAFVTIHGRVKRFVKIAGELVSLEVVETIARHASPQHGTPLPSSWCRRAAKAPYCSPPIRVERRRCRKPRANWAARIWRWPPHRARERFAAPRQRQDRLRRTRGDGRQQRRARGLGLHRVGRCYDGRARPQWRAAHIRKEQTWPRAARAVFTASPSWLARARLPGRRGTQRRRNGIAVAARPALREVTKTDVVIENGRVVAFRARVSLSFKYQPDGRRRRPAARVILGLGLVGDRRRVRR